MALANANAAANANQDIVDSMPGRYHQAEYQDILSKFDLVVISNLHDEDFVDFGIMDSKKYATKLLRLMEQHGLNQEEFTMCVVLATAVKSRKRILTAMRKFQGLGWYRAVLEFYNRATCQYTFEESEHSISIVHFSSSLPFLAARIWLQITQEPTVASFLANLWAAQIYLADDLMREQKAWETGFWTNTVTKGSKAYEGGVGTGKFNEDYWATKAKDYYLLLNADGSRFVRNPRTLEYEAPYTRADIEAWILTRSTPAPRAARAPRQPPGGAAGGPGGPGGPAPPGPPGQGDPAGPDAPLALTGEAAVAAAEAAAALLAQQPVDGQQLPDQQQQPQQQQPQNQQQPQVQPVQQQPEQAQGGNPLLTVPAPETQPEHHLGSPSSGVLGDEAAGGGAAGAEFLANFSLDQLGKAATDPNLAFLFDAIDEGEKQKMAEMTEDELRDRKEAIVNAVLEEEVTRRVGLDPKYLDDKEDWEDEVEDEY